jgi:branched-chain amino acid transport system permease protein
VFWVQLTIAGIATGCIYALAGMGLVLTYKATGVFNFAHGAMAMVVAYTMWQTRSQWHWPLWLAAAFSLLVVAPAIGVVVERLVFRPLNRRGASSSERLVATLGVFLICVGAALVIWKGKSTQGPRIFSNRALPLGGGLTLGYDQLMTVVLVIALSVGLWLLFKFTQIGIEIRAVVDRRDLSELASINANRVASLSWAMGTALAGITGVLLAPGGLDSYHLTLLVIETFSIAVVAGLTSLPIAVGAGIVILGIGNAYLLQFHPRVLPLIHVHLPSFLTTGIDQLKPSLSVVVLFVALILLRHLDEPADAGGRLGLISGRLAAVQRRRRGTTLGYLGVAAVGILLPFFLNDIKIAQGQVTLALIVVFTSIVCITGFCGYITLGQAGFAGFGAYISARLATDAHLPVIGAMLIGALAAVVMGLIAGYPALNRRGLFLGLTTLGVGELLYSFVFTNDVFRPHGLRANRASVFGWSLSGAHAFYWFELVIVALVLLLARNLRSGRLGRILAAMRDSETAAQSIGIDQRAFKLFIFAVSAFIAGLGGALLAQQAGVFTESFFDPITSLFWFTAVIVAGVGSIEGAVVGAVAYELLGVFLPAGKSLLVVAVGALFIGYLPGGSLVGAGERLLTFVRSPRRLMKSFAAVQTESAGFAETPRRPVVARPPGALVAVGRARTVASGSRRARRDGTVPAGFPASVAALAQPNGGGRGRRAAGGNGRRASPFAERVLAQRGVAARGRREP